MSEVRSGKAVGPRSLHAQSGSGHGGFKSDPGSTLPLSQLSADVLAVTQLFASTTLVPLERAAGGAAVLVVRGVAAQVFQYAGPGAQHHAAVVAVVTTAPRAVGLPLAQPLA